MPFKELDIKTPDGICDCYVATPEGPGPFPAVLFYMDVAGLRQSIRDAVERLAAQGYYVLAPNLFYRLGRTPVADFEELFKPENMPKMFEMVGMLTPEIVVADAKSFIEFAQKQPETHGKKVGIVGYCMSGGMALRIASHYPDKVAAAASFHGSFLGSDDPQSPHRLIGDAEAEIHVGLAAEDFVMPDDQIVRLREALEASGLKYEIETYPGTHHGFSLAGAPSYHKEQAERHWTKLLELFARNLDVA